MQISSIEIPEGANVYFAENGGITYLCITYSVGNIKVTKEVPLQ